MHRQVEIEAREEPLGLAVEARGAVRDERPPEQRDRAEAGVRGPAEPFRERQLAQEPAYDAYANGALLSVAPRREEDGARRQGFVCL